MYIIRYLLYFYITYVNQVYGQYNTSAMLVDIDIRPCVTTQWLCIRRTSEDDPLRVETCSVDFNSITFVALTAEHVKRS
jgi:hypothetical protein